MHFCEHGSEYAHMFSCVLYMHLHLWVCALVCVWVCLTEIHNLMLKLHKPNNTAHKSVCLFHPWRRASAFWEEENMTDVFHLFKWETAYLKYCWLPTDISAHQLLRPRSPLLNSGQPHNHGCSLDSLKGQRRHLWRPLCPAKHPQTAILSICLSHDFANSSSVEPHPVHLVQDRRALSDLDYGSHLTSINISVSFKPAKLSQISVMIYTILDVKINVLARASFLWIIAL